MKNLLAIVTAFSILAPVAGAFAETPAGTAAPHKAVSSAQVKKEGLTQVKYKHGGKHAKGKKHKAVPADKQH